MADKTSIGRGSVEMIPYIFRTYHSNGNLYREVYCLVPEIKDIIDITSAIWHREDGPALIQYGFHGNIVSEFYYINDEMLNYTEYAKWQIIRDLSLEVLK